jgi:hypothetical protein
MKAVGSHGAQGRKRVCDPDKNAVKRELEDFIGREVSPVKSGAVVTSNLTVEQVSFWDEFRPVRFLQPNGAQEERNRFRTDCLVSRNAVFEKETEALLNAYLRSGAAI